MAGAEVGLAREFVQRTQDELLVLRCEALPDVVAPPCRRAQKGRDGRVACRPAVDRGSVVHEVRLELRREGLQVAVKIGQQNQGTEIRQRHAGVAGKPVQTYFFFIHHKG